MNQTQEQEPKTFTDFLRRIFNGFLDSIAAFLNHLGVKPNVITASGLIGNLAAGIMIATGHLFWGGLIALIVGPLDALDGVLARQRNESSEYGAFVDSVTDRYSEMAIFGGLLVYFSKTGYWLDPLLVFFAAIGSFMVSYTRARAESLGYSAKIGLLSRAERYLILIPGVVLGYPRISLWIIAVLANFTALQRFLHVRKKTRGTKNQKMQKKE
ncbi:MAG: CDP-alcohol phosphatidyltransferase family protein [Chloroflexota bacterium]|nr:CDP-alcohol phosphatidyltransferase family protein [Chloroflexota bacterium]